MRSLLWIRIKLTDILDSDDGGYITSTDVVVDGGIRNAYTIPH